MLHYWCFHFGHVNISVTLNSRAPFKAVVTFENKLINMQNIEITVKNHSLQNLIHKDKENSSNLSTFWSIEARYSEPLIKILHQVIMSKI